MSEVVLGIEYVSKEFGQYDNDWLTLEQSDEKIGNAADFKKWANVTGNLPVDISDVFAKWESFVSR